MRLKTNQSFGRGIEKVNRTHYFGAAALFFVLFLILPRYTLERTPPSHSTQAPSVHMIVMGDLYDFFDGPNRAGMARLSAFIQDVRKSARGPVLVVHTGDAISPSIWGLLDRGLLMIEALNRLRIDAMVPGNHEYDFGPRVLAERVKEARFPVLAINNARQETAIPGIVPAIDLERGGLHVRIIGISGIRKFDERLLSRIQALIKHHSKGHPDLTILLTHEEYKQDIALLTLLQGIDLLLGGDEHHPVVWQVDHKLLLKPGAGNRTAARLVGHRTNGKWRWDIHIVSLLEYPRQDAEFRRWLLEKTQPVRKRLGVVVGRTDVPLDARRGVIRMRSTPWMNWVVDRMRTIMKADLAFLNAGAVRWERIVEPGTLRLKELYEAFPFGNTLAVVRLTGAKIREALEEGLREPGPENGMLLHVSGLSYAYDPHRPFGHRICRVTMADGTALVPEKAYTVAVNYYLYRGGGGIRAMKAGHPIIPPESGPSLLDVIRRAIVNAGIHPPDEPRIQIGCQ